MKLVSPRLYVIDFWSTIMTERGMHALSHTILSRFLRGYVTSCRPRSATASVLLGASKQAVHYYCLSENINYTTNARREKPSRASRKHVEVDESRLNPPARVGLLLRLTPSLSFLALANAAAIFKRS